MKTVQSLFLLPIVTVCSLSAFADNGYNNFKASVYSRVFEVLKMKDPLWLEETFEQMNQHLKIDKIYLETHRDMMVIDEDTLKTIIKFFKDRGIKTAGGITITVSEPNNFETYCYTNKDHRKKLKGVVELTARNFDEMILDDFFYTS